MRKSDLSPERQTRLGPVPGKPGVFALDPPPIGPLEDCAGRLAASDRMGDAVRLLEHLRAESTRLPQPDLVTRTLIRREAALSSHIEGTRSELEDLFEYECTLDDSRLPADVRTTLAYVNALEVGLQTVRDEGSAAFRLPFIQTLHRHLMEDEAGYRDVPGQLRTVQSSRCASAGAARCPSSAPTRPAGGDGHAGRPAARRILSHRQPCAGDPCACGRPARVRQWA